MESDALYEMAICLKLNGSNSKYVCDASITLNGTICNFENVSENDKEMAQSQTTDQPMASQEERKNNNNDRTQIT